MAYGQCLEALAEPTRRALYEKIRRRPRTVGELARAVGISQPGVSQHLGVLLKARLVTRTKAGTRRYYQPNPAGLAELRRYVESLWDDALAAYAAADHGSPEKGRR
jgi:DNA-binding transcriptional ArsR family regulator